MPCEKVQHLNCNKKLTAKFISALSPFTFYDEDNVLKQWLIARYRRWWWHTIKKVVKFPFKIHCLTSIFTFSSEVFNLKKFLTCYFSCRYLLINISSFWWWARVQTNLKIEANLHRVHELIAVKTEKRQNPNKAKKLTKRHHVVFPPK